MLAMQGGWKYASARGQIRAALLGFAMAQTEKPLDVRMSAFANSVLNGCAITAPYLNTVMDADVILDSTGFLPEAQEPETVRMYTQSVIQAFAFGYSYGLIYTSGIALGESSTIALPNVAGLVYGNGVAEGDFFGSAQPAVEEMLDIMLSAKGEADGIVTHETQAPENAVVGSHGEIISSCLPVTLPLYNVTFMQDGVELYTTKVVEGYDCTNPITAGEIEEPTKASTLDYFYTFSGWALTDGGAASASALTAISGNTVLYPAFTATKRTFADLTWAEISQVSESGEAESRFTVGETKTIDCTLTDGTTKTLSVVILGFNHDDLADGSGKAGITIGMLTADIWKTLWAGSKYNYYNTSYVKKMLENEIKSSLPNDLKAVIKTVSKECDTNNNYDTATQKTAMYSYELFALSAGEMGYTTAEKETEKYLRLRMLGEKYDYFPDFVIWNSTNNNPWKNVWIRNTYRNNSGYGYVGAYGTASLSGVSYSWNFVCPGYYSNVTVADANMSIKFGFCI